MKTIVNINSFKVLILLMLFAAFVSCRKEIDVDIPINERKIVLNSLLQKDSLLSAHLYISSHVQDNEVVPNPLINGEVLVYENDSVTDVLYHQDNGYYKSLTKTAEEGANYELVANAPNLTSARGSSNVVNQIPLISFDSVGVTKDPDGRDMVILEVKFKDTPNQENFYRVGVYLKFEHEFGTDYNLIWPQSNDPIIETFSSHGYMYFSDALIPGKEYSLQLLVDLYTYQYNEMLYVVFEHLSKDFYLYSGSVEAHMEAKEFGLFAQSVIVYNNIENGYGIVGSSAVSVDSIEAGGLTYEWEK